MSATNILEMIDHSFSGVLWITRNLPSQKDPHFHYIDYILNGLMKQRSVLDKNKVSLFFTTSFDKRFFVIHITNDEHLNDKLGNTLMSIKKQIPKDGKLLYIGEGNVYPKRAFSQVTNIEIVRA